MRPRKIILLVDADERTRGPLAFALDTHGYRVLQAASGAQAVAIFDRAIVDLVLVVHQPPAQDGDKIVRRLKRGAAWVPMALLGDPAGMADQEHHADALFRHTMPMVELLDRIKVLTARKRGPRKGSHRIALASAPAPVAEAVGWVATVMSRLQFLTIRRYLGAVFTTLVLLLVVLAIWG